jgi:hypothetical protein
MGTSSITQKGFVRGHLIAAVLLLFTGAPHAGAQSRANDIIARTVKASEELKRFRATMQEIDIAKFTTGEPKLSPAEEKRYATFVWKPQNDGSMIRFDRVDGIFEVESPARFWQVLQRVGGDGHALIEVSLDTAKFQFMTRNPDHVTRMSIDKTISPSIFVWMSRQLKEEAAAAKSITYLGREITQGTLCDIIELYLPNGGSKAPFAAPKDSARNRYYISVNDGLIRRWSATSAPKDKSGVANYRETMLTVVANPPRQDVTWDRFAKAAQEKLKGKPLPKIVMESRK